jgi:hypothetical protein
MNTLVKELSYHEAQSANGGERTYDGGTSLYYNITIR